MFYTFISEISSKSSPQFSFLRNIGQKTVPFIVANGNFGLEDDVTEGLTRKRVKVRFAGRRDRRYPGATPRRRNRRYRRCPYSTGA